MALNASNRRIAFSALYLTYFNDMLAWSIVLMIFAPMLIPTTSTLLPAGTSLETRNIIMGLLIATYPLAQFIAAPLLGELSDRFGRKRVLLFTTFISFVSFLISAISILMNMLPLLFISRLIAGVAGGNATLSQAGVADLTDENNRGRFMSFFAVASGIAWVLGPFLGGVLSDTNLVSWFNFSISFWTIGILFLVCFILTYVGIEDKHQPTTATSKFKIGQAFTNIFAIFDIQALRMPFLVISLMYFGWFFFMSFFSAYMIEKFQFSNEALGYIFAWASFWFAIGGVICNQWLLKKYQPENGMIWPFILLAISVFVSTFFTSPAPFWLILLITGVAQAIVSTCLFTIHSKLAGPENQGKVFGAINAMFALCFTVTPLLSSWFADKWLSFPNLLGGAILIIAAIIYISWYQKFKQ